MSMRSCRAPASSGLKLIPSLQKAGVDRMHRPLVRLQAEIRIFQSPRHVGRHGRCKEFQPLGCQRTYKLTEQFPKAFPLFGPSCGLIPSSFLLVLL